MFCPLCKKPLLTPPRRGALKLCEKCAETILQEEAVQVIKLLLRSLKELGLDRSRKTGVYFADVKTAREFLQKIGREEKE